MPELTVEQELAKGPNLSIITLVDCLIEKAQKSRASDIHIVPSPSGIRVRLRIDGVLQESYVFPKEIHGEVVSRIKVIAGLRTDQHQSTQDGRFRLVFPGSEEYVDIRVSIAPTYHGENVVMRLLSDKAQNYTLEMLGFSKSDQAKILKAIHKPNGMILATGPTGSGKTTTLYTLIKLLNNSEVSIVTLEDPIEYAVEGVEQIQVNAHAGLTFATGLRSILRQDPDIIMVGEIRDPDTASIAVNTALTGHLLLSTLHTNDAATTLPRLMEMHVEPYLVSSTVNIAIGQRLVRRICTNCKKEMPQSESIKASLAGVPLSKPFDSKHKLYRGIGCEECGGSGYRGRICINEVLVADAEIREALLKKASSSEIQKIALKNGMTTMLDDGFAKIAAGETTIEEVLRVVHD
ncbi:MAG: type II/IV secretion system protein [Candidatus Sungbacteria bacterium]|uniref:Type II/IV secretion system protein n=1 Tax=Candidatus Sungiibacteriota bacterium TaxID=2750080 RepID=A0A932R188_9BACT|nr:type II/IV secretion system protein [Candidatus Sungbacteria bacterium]